MNNISGVLRSNTSFASLVTTGGSIAGGLVGSVMFSYGAWLMGYGNLQDANRGFVIGAAGIASGILTEAVVLAAVQAFATASTGTAISTLGGAAATNAALAWLGGGSLAAGGGGAAVGSVLLMGGVTAVALAVSATVWYLWHMHDRQVERRRVLYYVQHLGEL